MEQGKIKEAGFFYQKALEYGMCYYSGLSIRRKKR